IFSRDWSSDVCSSDLIWPFFDAYMIILWPVIMHYTMAWIMITALISDHFSMLILIKWSVIMHYIMAWIMITALILDHFSMLTCPDRKSVVQGNMVRHR